MVETFYDLEELVDAVEGIREVSALPIVALLTFDEGAVTLAGVTAQEAAQRLADLDIAALGANHGAGLLAALAALEEMDGAKPLAALPNIGLASLAGGRVIFPHASPDYFASSPRMPASSARRSSAAAAGRPRWRSPRSGRQSRTSASRDPARLRGTRACGRARRGAA